VPIEIDCITKQKTIFQSGIMVLINGLNMWFMEEGEYIEEK
jgi:hypothetical protein